MRADDLGSAIRTFRMRRLQIHNDQPWTLDDLAVAMDDDKGHLSRIERGQIVPSRATLMRMARALSLTWPETEYLLRLAGAAPPYDAPEAEAILAAIDRVATGVRAYPHPVLLFSKDLRIWYANDLWQKLLGLTARQFRRCLQGRRVIDTMFGACAGQQLSRTYHADWPAAQRRVVARFRAFALAGDVAEEEVVHALRDPWFRRLWEEAEHTVTELSFPGEQSQSEFVYPGIGVLHLDSWWCPLQSDRRFLVTHYLPHTTGTRDALRLIEEDFTAPNVDIPCPVHDSEPDALEALMVGYAR